MTTRGLPPSGWVVRTVAGVDYVGSVEHGRYYVYRDGAAVANTGRSLVAGVTGDPAIWRAFYWGEES